MHNVILLSSDAHVAQRCSRNRAQQLLRCGLATITKFYPYTLQLKSDGDIDPSVEIDMSPKGPDSNSPQSVKKHLKLEESV